MTVAPPLIDRQLLNFWLYEWLGLAELLRAPQFRDHSRETVEATLDAADRLARDAFLPCYKEADKVEPTLVDGSVRVLPAIAAAVQQHAEAGFIAAPFDGELGGWQFPEVVHCALMAHFQAANIAAAGYGLLAIANARLISKFGTSAQVSAFAKPQLTGEALGTMCLSEPQAGSSLADVRARAIADGTDDYGLRYRLTANKMWISGGDHDITGNIFHLVLAKVAQSNGELPTGTKGLSLFVVPKYLDSKRNDVVVAGLNHKMGFRGTSNCLLNFGEGRYLIDDRPGAVGYLIGCEGQGIEIMFHMMNEARIAVGLGAASLAYRGHRLSLQYANERLQGRLERTQKSQIPIVDHPDVRRMLLKQKCYAEGGLSLVLYTARLQDECRALAGAQLDEANALLGLLTPIAKTWTSEWGLVANDIGIQIHGGYGYTRDFDVEQLYRDNRLNPIHEGTTGIQGIDFVNRKLIKDGGSAVSTLSGRVRRTVRDVPQDMRDPAQHLENAWIKFERLVADILSHRDADWPTWHASDILAAAGHLVVAWLLLDQSSIASSAGVVDPSMREFAEERKHLTRVFIEIELPAVHRSLQIAASHTDITTYAPAGLFSIPC